MREERKEMSGGGVRGIETDRTVVTGVEFLANSECDKGHVL